MKRILVISKDESTKRAFSTVFKELGLDAKFAISLVQARPHLKDDPCVILLDEAMLSKTSKDIKRYQKTREGAASIIILADDAGPSQKPHGLGMDGAIFLPRSRSKALLAPTLRGLLLRKAKLDEKEELIAKMQRQQEQLEALIKEKSEMLEESLLNYYTVVEHIQDGVAIIQGKNIVFTNKMFCSLLGYDQKDLQNKDASLVFPPEVCEMFALHDQPALAASIRQHENHILTKKAVLLPVEINIEHSVYNKKPSTLMFIKNITQRKKLQTKLIHASNMAAIGQIAVGLAHDLNTPLANISLLTENVYSRTSDENILKKLRTIHDQVDIITNTIKNLVVFYRRSKDLHADMNINEVVLDAIDRAKDLLTHNLDILLKLDDSVPIIHGNQEQMSQVFLNIILNADDAVGDEGNLVIRTSHDHDLVFVELADNGCGIPEEKLPQIFDAFYTTKKPNKGVGLGLPICQGIVHAHSGKIGVRSELGKGTTFKITLKR